jgi:hypothetical protein
MGDLPLRTESYIGVVHPLNSTTRLNDGIFTVHRFSVATSARQHQSECVFRSYISGGIFDNPPGFFLSARGTVCFCFLFFVFLFFVSFVWMSTVVLRRAQLCSRLWPKKRKRKKRESKNV